MPLIVNMATGATLMIEGEVVRMKDWKPGKIIPGRRVNGRDVFIRVEHVASIEIYPLAAFEADKAEAIAKAEAEQKRNPRPGRGPQIVLPRKP